MGNHLLIGTLGAGSVEAINQIPPVTNFVEVAKVVIQALIGLATILHMRKEYKNKNTNQQK